MAVMGRPTKINQRVTFPSPDNPDDTVTMTVGQAIIERIRQTGATPSLAGRAYVSADVVHKWVAEGRKQQQRLMAGKHMYAHERHLADFVSGCDTAFAAWTMERMELHDQIARGGMIIGEVTEEVSPTETEVDPATGRQRPLVLKRTVKQKRALPDASAIRWQLERIAKSERTESGAGLFTQQVEMVGAEGGPIEVESREDRAARLVRDIEIFEQGAAMGAEVMSQTQEAE